MRIRTTITQNRGGGVVVGCSGGKCPSLMLTEEGDVVVQGFVVSRTDKSTLGVPSGEDLVRMPRHVFEDLIQQLKNV